jgi:hypothetical protein
LKEGINAPEEKEEEMDAPEDKEDRGLEEEKEEEMDAPEEKEEEVWKSKWKHLRKRKREFGRGNECT